MWKETIHHHSRLLIIQWQTGQLLDAHKRDIQLSVMHFWSKGLRLLIKFFRLFHKNIIENHVVVKCELCSCIIASNSMPHKIQLCSPKKNAAQPQITLYKQWAGIINYVYTLHASLKLCRSWPNLPLRNCSQSSFWNTKHTTRSLCPSHPLSGLSPSIYLPATCSLPAYSPPVIVTPSFAPHALTLRSQSPPLAPVTRSLSQSPNSLIAFLHALSRLSISHSQSLSLCGVPITFSLTPSSPCHSFFLVSLTSSFSLFQAHFSPPSCHRHSLPCGLSPPKWCTLSEISQSI